MIIPDSDSKTLEKFFNNSAYSEYIYLRAAELIREGKSPEEAQKIVLEEVDGILDGSIVSEEDVKIKEDEPQETRGFCPTGPGGGMDNSCGKGGGGAKYAKGESMKRGDIKKGQRISIKKAGQKTVTTGVVQSVTHEKGKSEISLEKENGKVVTITIRDLAKITDEADVPSSPSKKTPGSNRPTPPDSDTPQAVANYGREVTEYCKSLGVEIMGGRRLEIGALLKRAANKASWTEVAAGVELCVSKGVPPPKIIMLDDDQDSGSFGWYNPREPNVVNVHSNIDQKRLDKAGKSGWLAGGNTPGAIVLHEAAHQLHDKAMRQGGGIGKGIVSLGENAPAGMRDAGEKYVSKYSGTEPAEFVAEVYTAHASGKKMPKRIWKFYKQLGGPPPPGGIPE